MLTKMGGHRTGQCLDGDVEGPDDAHVAEHGVPAGFGLWACTDAVRGGAETGQQLGGGTPPGVAVLDAERGHALLAQGLGRTRCGVALQEGQGDLAGHIGEDRLGSRPEGVQARLELVVSGHPGMDQVVPGPDHRPQRPGLVTEGLQDPQVTQTQPQVLGDDLGVTGIRLGSRGHLGLPPCLDGPARHGHHPMPGFEQPVDQSAVGALDRHRHLPGNAQRHQPCHQLGEPVLGVSDHEGGDLCAVRVDDTDSVLLGGPVDPHEFHRGRQFQLCHSALLSSVSGRVLDERVPAGRSLTGALRRFPLLPVSGPRESGGRQCHRGPRRATEPGRHPHPHRDLRRTLTTTAKEVVDLTRGSVDQ